MWEAVVKERPSEDIQDSLARQEPSRRKGWSSHSVQRLHTGLFISSPGITGARAVGTHC